MNDQQKMMFLAQYNGVRKDGTTGVLLALFLGGFGAHRFYLNQTGLGILYALFFWTFLPGIVAFVEIFLMSDRVRTYNMQQAQFLSMQIRAAFPANMPVAPPPGVMSAGLAPTSY